METVKIVHDTATDGFCIINESDFDLSLHTLFDKKPNTSKTEGEKTEGDDKKPK